MSSGERLTPTDALTATRTRRRYDCGVTEVAEGNGYIQFRFGAGEGDIVVWRRRAGVIRKEKRVFCGYDDGRRRRHDRDRTFPLSKEVDQRRVSRSRRLMRRKGWRRRKLRRIHRRKPVKFGERSLRQTKLNQLQKPETNKRLKRKFRAKHRSSVPADSSSRRKSHLIRHAFKSSWSDSGGKLKLKLFRKCRIEKYHFKQFMYDSVV